MKIRMFLAVVLGMAVLTLALQAGPAFQKGKWEITSKTEMIGTKISIPPVKFTQCIDDKNMVPKNKETNKDCKTINQKISAGTVSWEMVCDGKDAKVQGRGQMTYQDKMMTGEFNITANVQGKTSVVVNKMTGKYLGACQ
jgi:hypothetical protein